jgi:hypothetical protein
MAISEHTYYVPTGSMSEDCVTLSFPGVMLGFFYLDDRRVSVFAVQNTHVLYSAPQIKHKESDVISPSDLRSPKNERLIEWSKKNRNLLSSWRNKGFSFYVLNHTKPGKFIF